MKYTLAICLVHMSSILLCTIATTHRVDAQVAIMQPKSATVSSPRDTLIVRLSATDKQQETCKLAIVNVSTGRVVFDTILDPRIRDHALVFGSFIVGEQYRLTCNSIGGRTYSDGVITAANRVIDDKSNQHTPSDTFAPSNNCELIDRMLVPRNRQDVVRVVVYSIDGRQLFEELGDALDLSEVDGYAAEHTTLLVVFVTRTGINISMALQGNDGIYSIGK